jgi:hypothetical protein
MKIILRCLTIALLSSTFVIQAQRKPRIKGNREVVEVKEALPSFTKIELKDDLDVVLNRAMEESYSVTADDNLIDVLKFQVKDSTLVISAFYQITSKKEMKIEVSYNQLSAILLSDGSITTSEKINSDRLTLISKGSSRMELGADVGQLRIEMQDNSRASLNLTADSLVVRLRNKADANIYVNSFSNTIDLKEDALLKIDGTANNLQLSLDGNTRLRAEDLDIGELNASMIDSSESRIFVRDQLQIRLMGSSRCYLYGNPVIALSEFKDTAEFFKRNK